MKKLIHSSYNKKCPVCNKEEKEDLNHLILKVKSTINFMEILKDLCLLI